MQQMRGLYFKNVLKRIGKEIAAINKVEFYE